MRISDLKHFQRELRRRHDDLRGRFGRTEMAVPSDPGSAGGDASASRRATLEEELAEIHEALARIDAGSYGRCETCGGSVSAERLRKIPQARECTPCSARRSADAPG